MKKLIVFLIVIFSLAAYGFTIQEKINAIDKLINKLKKEMTLLQQGKKNVNGFALFGFDCPKRLLTGDDYKDQLYSSQARIRMIKKEILVFEELKKEYKKELRKKFKNLKRFKPVLKDLDRHDFGGRYEEIKPDGGYDYPLDLEVNFPNKKIKNIEIRNINGKFTVWDSIPHNGKWALIISEFGELLQKRNSALKKPLPAVGRYTLYLPDNGSIFRGKTAYKITLFFTDGTKESTSVINRVKRVKHRISAELVGLSNKDYGGRYETIKPDGEKDYLVVVKLKCKLKRIKEIKIKNTSGKFSVWDTIPHNKMWALAVVRNGRLMSKRDSSVNFLLTKDNEKLYLYLPDNGSIKRGRTHYKILIFFADGNRVSCKVKRRF